ncbi:MAG: hypothetical protein DMG06_24140 [Acidobacteria bacterium]|nr:MAG: hypothetical protein DMG06_24140 [Acidobacteriota bacterium]
MNPNVTSAHGSGSPSNIDATSNVRRWIIVGLLFTASLINYFDRATISFALPLISKTLSLGPEVKGVLLSAFFWSYALMQIPMGLCSDRLNLRWLYAGAFVLWSVAQGLTGFATTLGMLLLFRVILGIGEAIYLPGGTKIVSLLFSPSERGLPCGIFDFGTRTGLVAEGLVVPWLLTQYGWQTTFQVVGFTALLWVIPWIWATPRQLRANSPAASEDLAGAGSGHSSSQQPALDMLVAEPTDFRSTPAVDGNVRAPLIANVRQCIRSAISLSIFLLARYKNLIGICLGFFCFDYYWYLLVTWLPDYLVNVRQMTILKAGIYASLPFLVFGSTEPIGGWIADRLARAGWDETRVRKGIITVAFLTGLLLIPASQVTNANTAIALIIGGCLVGLSTANMLVILQYCAPAGAVGLWTGIFNFVGNVAGILAPLVTGKLIQATGSYTPPFVLAAVALAVGQLSFWLIVGRLPARR